MKAWNKGIEKEGTDPAMPMKPQVIGWELGKRTREGAIIVADSGTNTTVWARYMPAKRGQMHSCSGNLATMACALPYAIAAQIAYPERQVVAVIGDGGAQLDRALALPGPVVIEAVVDPLTAMLPARIKADQAIKFSEALARGEPNRIRIALTAVSDTVRQII